jgi:hypothetical protein
MAQSFNLAQAQPGGEAEESQARLAKDYTKEPGCIACHVTATESRRLSEVGKEWNERKSSRAR